MIPGMCVLRCGKPTCWLLKNNYRTGWGQGSGTALRRAEPPEAFIKTHENWWGLGAEHSALPRRPPPSMAGLQGPVDATGKRPLLEQQKNELPLSGRSAWGINN
ncbi:MAG: hypothetical protein CM15mP120_21400 [Pseudomonadota bacterium]|nr:MAG: hypothetical protein CM15mP120_21400 [Pseudomonadota bacterium]